MRRTRVKICGLARAEDVLAAVDAGADACGFIFAPSPRRLTIDEAAALCELVPPPVGRVGVFVDADLGFVCEAVARCGLTSLQFSGAESPEACSLAPRPVVKVLAVGTEFDFGHAEPYQGHAASLLLDTYDPQRAGGTSQSFEWRSIGELPGWAPIVVAGGLTPARVADAIRILRPFGVDVSSGVETSPGVKDRALMDAFCAAVRSVDEEVYGR